jgi:WD40 repeat protein
MATTAARVYGSGMVLLLLGAALAHQPHDVVSQVAVSPALARDGFVLVVRSPNQNWRPVELAASRDGARSWQQAIRGLTSSSLPVDVDLSPDFEADGVALVTTAGDGAWLSSDGARTWSRLTTPEDALLGGAIAREPSGGLVLLAAPATGGLSRSTDGGAGWTSLPGPPVSGLAASGSGVITASGRVVAVSSDGAATFSAWELDGRVSSVAVGDGTFAVTTPTGVWRLSGADPVRAPGFPAGVTRVGLSPGAAPELLATAPLDAAVYRSVDGGDTVERVALPVGLSPQSDDHFSVIAFSGTYAADRTVLLGTFEGLLVSNDGGSTWWESDTRPPGVINALAVSPEFPDDRALLVASYDAGMWASLDGGRRFSIRNDDLYLSSVYDVAFAQVPGGVEAMLAGNAQVYLGRPPFDGWTRLALPAEADYTTRVALSPRWADDGVALAGTRANGVWRTSDGGATWAQVFPERDAISGLAWGPDGRTVLAGTERGRLWRSEDDGGSFVLGSDAALGGSVVWVEAGPDGFLVGAATGAFESPDGAALAPIDGLSGPVQQVAVAPDGTRFVSMRGGDLWRAAPGEAFAVVDPALTEHGTVSELAISPAYPADGVVFAALDEALWRSTDGGDHFERMGMARVRYEEDAQALVPRNVEVREPGASTTGIEILRPSDEVTLVVRCTGFEVLGATGPDLGTADVWLDGALAGSIDQRGAAAQQVAQWASGPLPEGVHELRLVPTGSWDVHLDAVDVLRPVPPLPPADSGQAHTGDGPDPHTGAPTDPTTKPGPPIDGGCGCRGAPAGAGAWLPLLLALSATRARSARGARRRP